jgi:uncharacterized damage-inducible protein DinB
VCISEQSFRFDYCANISSLQALGRASSPLAEGTRILCHIAGINDLWLNRIEAADASLGAWPIIPLHELPTLLASQRDRWLSLVAKYPGTDPIRYVTRTGESVVNSFVEIALEVLLHAAHHRGQIALLLRQSLSQPPASTDYIPTLRGMAALSKG